MITCYYSVHVFIRFDNRDNNTNKKQISFFVFVSNPARLNMYENTFLTANFIAFF
jgi:hypothetical protein